MYAMVFAAGLGTRLKPLTLTRPKALCALNGIPLLEIVLQRLAKAGVTHIVVNAHHFAQQIQQYLAQREPNGLTVYCSVEADILLDTGGGLLHAQPFFEGVTAPFFVHNADIITNLNLKNLYAAHLQQSQKYNQTLLATLAVQNRISSRQLLFDANGLLNAWQHINTKTNEIIQLRQAAQTITPPLTSVAFSGVQVVHPKIFKVLRQQPNPVFSIIEAYLAAAQQGLPIRAFNHTGDIWCDTGTPQHLAAAEALLPSFFPD